MSFMYFLIVCFLCTYSYILGYKAGVNNTRIVLRKVMWQVSKRMSAQTFNELAELLKEHNRG